MTKNYDESSIEVLDPIQAVQLRPGMYTNVASPLHIIQEVFDNAVDEALGGYGKRIVITAYQDGSIQVQDEGRGIPVGLHPKEKRPVVEIAYTALHAGGKFDKADENSSYRFSGGLHGVGVSVTNALSFKTVVTVRRDKEIHQVEFAEGKVTKSVHKIGTCLARETGTTVRVWTNPKYFDSPKVPLDKLELMARQKAMLLPGVAVVFQKETSDGSFEEREYQFENGISQFIESELQIDSKDPFLFSGEKYEQNTDNGFATGEGCACALYFAQESGVGLVRESFVNLINTPQGGTHEAGLKSAAFEAVKNFIEISAMMPRGVKLTSEDVTSKISWLISAKVLDPIFQGQTKNSLTSKTAVKLVASNVKPMLELWLADHPDIAKQIADSAIKAAQARQRSAKTVEKKKSGGLATLPGKLTDCESDDVSRRELYLVEGDSAGGSTKMGRDKEFQAVLPLRGKVLNTFEVEQGRLFANREVHDISVAVGVDPHTHQDSPDLSGLRYSKICILSDADVDGSHIQVLLLTLFYCHFPKLVENGNIYIAQPPLYRVDVPAMGKKPMRKIYCIDENELVVAKDHLQRDGVKEDKITVSRFKGLGEMNPEQLWEAALDPATRTLVQLQTDDFTGKTFADMASLMAKGKADDRKQMMEEMGYQFDIAE